MAATGLEESGLEASGLEQLAVRLHLVRAGCLQRAGGAAAGFHTHRVKAALEAAADVQHAVSHHGAVLRAAGKIVQGGKQVPGIRLQVYNVVAGPERMHVIEQPRIDGEHRGAAVACDDAELQLAAFERAQVVFDTGQGPGMPGRVEFDLCNQCVRGVGKAAARPASVSLNQPRASVMISTM